MIGWIFAGISIIGCLLNINKIIWCWLVWTVASIGMTIINYNAGRWDQMTAWGVYIPMNIYGYYQWRKDEHRMGNT